MFNFIYQKNIINKILKCNLSTSIKRKKVYYYNL